MALPDIIAALENGTPLPDRAVAITIDDGYLSVYEQAWPRLRDAGIPFTLFLSTDSIDAEYKSFMRWDHVREMVAGGNVTKCQAGSRRSQEMAVHWPPAESGRYRQTADSSENVAIQTAPFRDKSPLNAARRRRETPAPQSGLCWPDYIHHRDKQRYRAQSRAPHVREMVAGGNVTIGHHGAAHQHMPHYDDARNLVDIRRASLR